MALEFLILAALAAVGQAVVIGAPAYPYGPAIAKVAAPVAYGPAIAKVAAPGGDYDPNPQYSYSYDIHDAITGDAKSQQESRSGDVVQGSYSLVEPDGTRRVVEYTADPVNGFNAVVHREPVATKVVAPVAKFAAPIPIAKYGSPYAAPYAPLAAKLPLGYPGLLHH